MEANELAEKAWAKVDKRPIQSLPDEFQFRLRETALHVIKGESGGIAGLEEFESAANEIVRPQPVEKKKKG